ncbi:MAG: CDP-diacylglycerol--glycerol-3-phosphate 3-phosphatidyltransferase [Clostridiales Family XIII bacterium]|jgi:CDP-diacylglycerol--glycerol-3-phosphate 3-phosphatidyltransferase/cardiolipin synthase|nr:CDP-diacylglycerol--glycerol-3-phosphate 3-phosphatidyltransferase [Clostridiales Family XIII bacterium]
MNLPNILTVIRMAIVPVFIVCYYLGAGAGGTGFAIAAFVIFVAASITDAMDGHLARSRGLETNFGKLMDPLADKALTAAAFICFVDTGTIPSWMAIVIIIREFLVTGLRSVAASSGVVIAAGNSGKLKTVLQMVTISLFLLSVPLSSMVAGSLARLVATVCLWSALAVTVYSGVEYVWKCRGLLNMK